MTDKTSSKKGSQENKTYAIVEASGSQFWLEPNRYYDLDRIDADVNQKITLEKILLLNDGKTLKLGQPYVEGAIVHLKVMGHRRGPKILVYKMRPKKKTRRKNGHRQELTRVMVEKIALGTKTKTEQVAQKDSTKPSKAKTPKAKTSVSSKGKEEVK
tara:strand:+ start:21883 stop:22353 length:471 start_codon:yes stop_codon:yes gene_type:complete